MLHCTYPIAPLIIIILQPLIQSQITTEPTAYEDSGGPGLEMGGVDENLADLQPEDSDSEEEGQEGGPVLTPDQQACDMHVHAVMEWVIVLK